MVSREEFFRWALDTIKKALGQDIVLEEESRINGERVINNGHKTMYIIYDGQDIKNEPFEKIKIIGETWNCGFSGTSIICIGFAQITNNSQTNISFWERIIKDKEGTFGLGEFQGLNGLLYNVKCH